jgi:hypothetical protein
MPTIELAQSIIKGLIQCLSELPIIVSHLIRKVMKNQITIGVDVSKETLDFAVLLEGTKLLHIQVSNNEKGITARRPLNFAKSFVSK